MNTYATDLEGSFSSEHSTEIYGSLNYLSHPATDLYVMSVAGDDGFRWSGRPEEFNWDLLKDARVIAHNASFDLGIYDAWGRRGHPPLPRPKDFNCTAHLAGYLGAPQNLVDALGNDNYHSFSGGSYFSRLFWVLSARFFGVFLGWFSAFAGAGFRPPGGRRRKAGASVASGGILGA
jgi:hypothetical protein